MAAEPPSAQVLTGFWNKESGHTVFRLFFVS